MLKGLVIYLSLIPWLEFGPPKFGTQCHQCGSLNKTVVSRISFAKAHVVWYIFIQRKQLWTCRQNMLIWSSFDVLSHFLVNRNANSSKLNLLHLRPHISKLGFLVDKALLNLASIQLVFYIAFIRRSAPNWDLHIFMDTYDAKKIMSNSRDIDRVGLLYCH